MVDYNVKQARLTQQEHSKSYKAPVKKDGDNIKCLRFTDFKPEIQAGLLKS